MNTMNIYFLIVLEYPRKCAWSSTLS